MSRGRRPLPDAIKRAVRELRAQGMSRREISRRLQLDTKNVHLILAAYRRESKRLKRRYKAQHLIDPVICPKCRKLIDVLPCLSEECRRD